MTFILSAFIGIIASIILIFCLQFIYKEFRKPNVLFDQNSIWFSLIGILVSIFLLMSSYIVYEKIKEYEQSTVVTTESGRLSQNDRNVEVRLDGSLGDLVGGIYSPAIGLIGILFAGLAFYVQYKANIQVKEQFKLQQFESQFYELLRLHKENVNEMLIQGYVFDGKKEKIEREIKGRKIFVTNIVELNSLIKTIKNYLEYANVDYFPLFKDVKNKDDFILYLSYKIFFFGLDALERQVNKIENSISDKKLSLEDKNHLIKMISFMREFQSAHFNHGEKKLSESKSRICTNDIELKFNYKPFSGHLSRYGHYYRNLILIVKHIVCNDELDLSYLKKRDYLRILRAQLTSHEQFLLFVNWYTEIGSEWEEDEQEGNKFFTDYRMIHNLNFEILDDSMLSWEDMVKRAFCDKLDFKYLNDRDKSLFEVIAKIESNQLKPTK